MNEKPFEDVSVRGGYVQYSPPGVFVDEVTKEKKPYDEKVKITAAGGIYRLPPQACNVIYQAIRDSTDLADFCGVKKSII